MEETILDDDMKLMRSDPSLLNRICEQLANENAALDQAFNGHQESEALQQPDPTDNAYHDLVSRQEDGEDEYYDENMIEVNKKYDTMMEVRLAAIEYGRRHKFAVSTLRSGARQLVLACKHSGRYRGTKKAVEEESPASVEGDLPSIALEENAEPSTTIDTAEDTKTTTDTQTAKRTRKKVSRKIQCPFQIRAKPVKGQWVVYKMDLEHNHPMAADSNAYAQHRKLNAETQQKIVKLMRSNQSNTQIVEHLRLQGVRNVVKKDIANLRQLYLNPNSKRLASAGNIPVEQSQNSEETQVLPLQENIQSVHPQQPEHEQLEFQNQESQQAVAQQAVTQAPSQVSEIDVMNQRIEQLERLHREHEKLTQDN